MNSLLLGGGGGERGIEAVLMNSFLFKEELKGQCAQKIVNFWCKLFFMHNKFVVKATHKTFLTMKFSQSEVHVFLIERQVVNFI